MHALPFLLAFLSALALAPTVLGELVRGGRTYANYRGRELPSPFGVLVLVSVLTALLPLLLVAKIGSLRVFHPEEVAIAIYALGVLGLGLLDDILAPAGKRRDGTPAPRGLRGHAAAALRGELSTGALKAVGATLLALVALDHLGLSGGRWLLSAAVVVLATNVFNLLDLRPGRALKAFLLLGAGLTAGSGEVRPLWSLGLFSAPALLAGGYDLRERAMLGDTGANLLGALAGLWLVLTLSATGQVVAATLLAATTLYGELRSISQLVERTPGLRQLDSWGRPS